MIEVKTLFQTEAEKTISKEGWAGLADQELARYLNDGWEIVSVSGNTHWENGLETIRAILLIRGKLSGERPV